jgi:formylglycine-generating enzyme required for sulfatase activity
MKYIILLSAFLILGWSSGKKKEFDIKAAQKNLVQVKENLYASKTEVSNFQYASFLNYLKRNNKTKEYELAKIDSTKWREGLSFNEPFVTHYHAHPAYSGYPVVNISYEGATMFCEWLTETYNKAEKRKYKKVVFRLPTEEEWVIAAKGGNPAAIYPWEGSELRDKRGMSRCNAIREKGDTMGTAGFLNDGADITATVVSYQPNKIGLYNMSGNVAEMLLEKGRTKGGSWLDDMEAMKIESNGKYATFTNPAPAVGFRYFMEVKE